MIQIIHDNRSALVREPDASYPLDLGSVNQFIQIQKDRGYEIVKVSVNLTYNRYTSTSIFLDKPKKAVKKSYPYWLRKKRL